MTHDEEQRARVMGEILHEQMIRTEFGDGRMLLTPRPEFENEHESYAVYDPAGDTVTQHREVEVRLRRFFKRYVRRMLNAFVKLRHGAGCVRAYRDGIACSGYTPSSLTYYRALIEYESIIARVTDEDFAALVDHARTVGFATDKEAASLLSKPKSDPIPIDETLDPRPKEYAPRPIIIERITEYGDPIDEEGNPVDRPRPGGG
jgi:hypothetical protein